MWKSTWRVWRTCIELGLFSKKGDSLEPFAPSQEDITIKRLFGLPVG
jgi:hypothetical protein